jgi:hypothetical protein
VQTNPTKYRSIGVGFGTIVREQGVPGLFRGWLPTLMGYSAQGAFKFGLYEYFKKWVHQGVLVAARSLSLEDFFFPRSLGRRRRRRSNNSHPFSPTPPLLLQHHTPFQTPPHLPTKPTNPQKNRTYADAAGAEAAAKYQTPLFLAASASAEFFADAALSPFEAVKVAVQTRPGFAKGLSDGLPKLVAAEGMGT